MRIGLDATPLLGPRSGIGRYVSELVGTLPAVLDEDDDLTVTAFTLRGAGRLHQQVPIGVSARSTPVPARLLRAAWGRTSFPPVGLLAGRVDLFHGTNFVLPPTGRAAGVVTVHDLTYLHLPETVSADSRRYVDLVPRSLSRAGAVCVPSRSVADEVLQAYPDTGGRVVVTPLGVDPSWGTATAPSTDWLRSRGIDGDYLLFLGNVEPRKDLATVVSAYRTLAGRGHVDLPQLVLVGAGGWGAGLHLTGIPDRLVVRLGRQPEQSVQALVAGARALVYPSRYEGFGLPVLEAFACGTPLLASDIPTTREVLGTSADLATLFPVGDVDAVAHAVVSEVDSTEESRRRRRSVAAGWTWTRTARATLDAYELALGRS